MKAIVALVGLMLVTTTPTHAELMNHTYRPLLKITAIATSLKHPREYEALHVWLPFDTSFTCGAGEASLDTPTIAKVAEHVLEAERKHITVRRVVTECVEANPHA